MHHPLLVAGLGFALERAALEAAERRLAETERCLASCDEGHDSHCDEQDAAGRYTRSCDMHPTTSCDADCRPSPAPPPRPPWLGASGTYPSPPPPPPPPDEELLIAAWVYFAVALALLACAVLFFWYRQRGERQTLVAYWCCCLLPLFEERKSRWRGGRDDDRAAYAPGEKPLPPALLLLDR